jgi:hypothetical protein
MHWITENPWPLIVLLTGSAVTGLIILDKLRFTVSGALLVAAAAVWSVDAAVVTPSEQLQDQLQQMLLAFVDDDLPAIKSQISDTAPDLESVAESGLELVQLHSTFHIKDVRIETASSGTMAIATLRANGTATLRRNNMHRHVATRWKTTWKLESGAWKLADVKRLDVVTGEEIDMLTSG